jgi:lysophospholipid acyltransferase (LPLAT)-like uncharacterized protein
VRTPGKLSPRLTFAQRAAVAVIPRLAALAIAAVGVTLRFETLLEDGAYREQPPTTGIYCFWHQCTFLAGWYFRKFRCSILISRSFDGELVARTLGVLGYGAERGSSSRGAVAGLLALKGVLDRGDPVVFTADGPRGPIYVTKAGPVKLAQMSGQPIGGFYLLAERAWTRGSWDRFIIPKPFSRVAVSWMRKLPAPTPTANEAELEAVRVELNAALERARLRAEEHFTRQRQSTMPS